MSFSSSSLDDLVVVSLLDFLDFFSNKKPESPFTGRDQGLGVLGGRGGGEGRAQSRGREQQQEEEGRRRRRGKTVAARRRHGGTGLSFLSLNSLLF